MHSSGVESSCNSSSFGPQGDHRFYHLGRSRRAQRTSYRDQDYEQGVYSYYINIHDPMQVPTVEENIQPRGA